MFDKIRSKIYVIILWLFVLFGCVLPMSNYVEAVPPTYYWSFVEPLKGEGGDTEAWYIITIPCVSKDQTLRENVICLFYPNWSNWTGNVVYNLVRDMTLWIMIVFIVWAWASLLFNRKPDDMKKTLWSLVYILLWWCFVYWANRLFGFVLDFSWGGEFTASTETWINPIVDKFTWGWWVLFVVLSAIKAFAFFMAIIMTVVTWIRVIWAWNWEKWKKLVKWLINIVVALLVIKWIDFVFYIAEDSENFLQNASKFIVNVAKVFAYIYGVLIVLMVIISWYLYMTDWWDWSNFKKASNILVNILLSALVLFAFLLILYQIFKEFAPWWDAVTMLLRNIV